MGFCIYMKPLYIQRLLTVMLEEYEDIEYMLSTLEAETATPQESRKIRALLKNLDEQNHRLLERLHTPLPKKIEPAGLRSRQSV